VNYATLSNLAVKPVALIFGQQTTAGDAQASTEGRRAVTARGLQ